MKKLSVALVIMFLTTSLLAITINIPGDQESIQEGINAAIDGDTVLVANGTYYENINFKGKAITVASQFFVDGDTSHISNTIIDGSQPSNPDSGSVVYFISGEDTTSVLCGFTITKGTGTYGPIEGKIYRVGGGIFILFSGGKIINNRIIKNELKSNEPEGNGAGLMAWMEWNDVLVLKNNLISENKSAMTSSSPAGYGGGAHLGYLGTIICENNQITKNVIIGDGGGGGLYVGPRPAASSIVINSNIISENSDLTGRGGGLNIGGSSPTVINNLIYNNVARYGGGIRIGYSGSGYINPVLINNTIVGNEAKYGGGIYTETHSKGVLMNNIVWANTATESEDGIRDISTGKLSIFYSNIQGSVWSGEGNISADPLFFGSQFKLSDGSPCIGAGVHSVEVDGLVYSCPETDCGCHQRPDPPGSNPDMGAFENPLENPVGTSVKNQKLNEQPMTYSLEQNYPNPFNPTTTIAYEVPSPSAVTLTIYDVLGHHVRTLVTGKKSKGQFQVVWDGTDEHNMQVAAGVYLYKIEAGEFVKVNKLVLVR